MIISSGEPRSGEKCARRHAWAAALCAVLPGGGQFYHRQWAKGMIFLVLLGSYLGVFHDFLRTGLWGVSTLGEEVPRDNSIFLLAEGIISLLIIAFGVLFYAWSINDAWRNGKRRDDGLALNSVRQQYRLLLSEGFPYLMITPGFILLVFVVIFPILFGFSIAFTNYNLYHTPPAKLVEWVGMKNFVSIFTLSIWRSTFLDVLQWTVVWTLLATTLQCTVGVLLAILVNQKDLRFKPLVRTIFILPWAVPGFVTILVFAGMFNDSFGVINNAILASVGISPKAWLTDPFWTKTALIMMQTWLGFPFVFAMTTGVLQAIPDDLYEAATMDGASRWTQLRTITLPLVLYSIAPIIITQYTFNFNNFNIIYLFNNGGPAVAGSNAGGTDILVSWIYKLTMSSSQYAIAATITILLSIFVVGLALWQFRATRSFKHDEMA
ncbi:Maltose transport system permease protein MalF [Dickeya dianthicola]|uniref:Sugar ABC transporter permease n=1 Tax=Dickeya dianthicola TaxID=204039 RepID=A0AAP6VHX4_9GAMM|nr:sugar ABC transporter permease [Dickeya dianthicola]ATO34001.1 Maltose/maltodextrin ABC transporter, permeas protein MalF [Dickeya dianthicola RNS04.9]AYC19947.1 Maltose transport system permease protein MalF [Dickeya dianthicola]MBI0438254.1 sugar ABC transporter permease [Dickeya dianthicola]MBI0448799.1 sugar ABC transporter permease [Dickeya dianthicola]MBI0453370.1 sugar ABC transporter permease [Dickeya dianthicola]